MSTGSTAVYRLDLRHVLRLVGLRLVIAAGLVVVAAILLGFGGFAGAVAYALGVVVVVLVLLAVVPLVRPPSVVRLDGHGYRVRRVRDCGARSGAWTEIRRVDHKSGDLGQSLVIALEDGRTTYVPLVLVAGQATRMQRDIHDRLNAAHGYRKLPSAGAEAAGESEVDWHRQEPT